MRRRTRQLASLTGLTLAVALGSTACKKGPDGPMPLCSAEVASGTAVESEVQELPADIWFSILLSDFDRDRMVPADAPQDCTGSNSLAPTLPPRIEGEEDAEEGTVAGCPVGKDIERGRLPARPLTNDDIVINEGPDSSTLIWVKATHYDTGEAVGPVARVEWTSKGVAVRNLGTLRAYAEKARMRVEVTGGGQDLLVVESDNCSFDDKICQRIMKLLPVVNERFVTVPLKQSPDEGGACIGEAEFAMFEQYTSDLPDGWVRKFEIARSVSFDGEFPLVAEQIVIRDKDPGQPEAPAQDFRQAANDRTLLYQDRYFETRTSVWNEMIDNYGSVAHDASAADEEDED